MAKLTLKDIVLNGTREELVEYNYNEMLNRTLEEHGIPPEKLKNSIKHLYKIMAETNADMVIAMRPGSKK